MASSSSTKVNVRVKVIGDMEQRGKDPSSGKRNGACDVIDSMTKTVKTLYTTERHISTFKTGQFYMIRGVVLGDVLRITDQTTVLSCGAFQFDPDIENAYTTPPAVTVEEALASPPKRRISLTGTLSDVSDLLVTERSKRKLMKISDGRNHFTVKLWGDKSSQDMPPIGSEVTITGVSVAEYRGNKEGNSTGSTSVIECADEHPFEGTIDAASFDGENSWIVLKDDDDIYSVPSTILQTAYPDLKFVPDVHVTGTKRGHRVLRMEIQQPQ